MKYFLSYFTFNWCYSWYCNIKAFCIVGQTLIWAPTWENVPSYMCAQRRLKSACASAQSDLSLPYPHGQILHLCLSKMCQMKSLIRLFECAGWSESSVGAFVNARFLILRLICELYGRRTVPRGIRNQRRPWPLRITNRKSYKHNILIM